MSPVIKATDVGVRFPWGRGNIRKLRHFLVGPKVKDERQGEWFWALRGVSFTLEEGDVLGIIGHNGAGKSTLLRALGGIYALDEGRIEIWGTISSLLALGAGFEPELTGLENIYINGVMMGFSEKEVKAVLSDIIDFSELGDFIQLPIKTYSTGMLSRLGFSIAVHLKRDIMAIDEILGVGDRKFMEKCEKKLKEILKEGRTVILVSHDMNAIRQFATKVLWLDHGHVRGFGDTEEIIEQYLSA